MTQEDKQLLLKDLCARLPLCDSNFNSVGSIDCLNVHHFDYRGLIGKNLAIGRTIGRTLQLKLLKIITLIIKNKL